METTIRTDLRYLRDGTLVAMDDGTAGAGSVRLLVTAVDEDRLDNESEWTCMEAAEAAELALSMLLRAKPGLTIREQFVVEMLQLELERRLPFDPSAAL